MIQWMKPNPDKIYYLRNSLFTILLLPFLLLFYITNISENLLKSSLTVKKLIVSHQFIWRRYNILTFDLLDIRWYAKTFLCFKKFLKDKQQAKFGVVISHHFTIYCHFLALYLMFYQCLHIQVRWFYRLYLWYKDFNV